MNPTLITMTTETCDGCECAILRSKCYYLHFPDGTEEWFCNDCQSSLRSGYIAKADHRGFGLEERWGDDEEEEEEEEEEEIFDRKYPNATCLRCCQTVTGQTVMLCGGGGGLCETWYCEDCHEAGTHDCRVCHSE
jgi:hypothetical protein